MQIQQKETYQHHLYPDERGRFGPYGGKFVPESLMAALAELETAYQQACSDPAFQAELQAQLSLHFNKMNHLTAMQNKYFTSEEPPSRLDLTIRKMTILNNAFKWLFQIGNTNVRIGPRRLVISRHLQSPLGHHNRLVRALLKQENRTVIHEHRWWGIRLPQRGTIRLLRELETGEIQCPLGLIDLHLMN